MMDRIICKPLPVITLSRYRVYLYLHCTIASNGKVLMCMQMIPTYSIYCYSSRVVSVRLNLSFSVEFLLYLCKALSRSLFCTPPHHVAASGGGGRRGRMVQAGMTNRSVT